MSQPKYTAVRVLIETGAITKFKEIFGHVPIEEVAEDLDWEVSFLHYLVDNPSNVTMNNVKALSDLTNCELEDILKIVLNQFLAERGK